MQFYTGTIQVTIPERLPHGCRIYQLLLCRRVRLPPPPPDECPRYDTKQSDGEVPVL